MNKTYYVNKNAQQNGDHEVHVRGCSYFPNEENAIFLGIFPRCKSAVKKAKQKGYNANGCFWCVNECHTS